MIHAAVVLLVIAQIMVLVLAFRHFDHRIDKIASDNKDTLGLLSDLYSRTLDGFKEADDDRNSLRNRLDFLVKGLLEEGAEFDFIEGVSSKKKDKPWKPRKDDE